MQHGGNSSSASDQRKWTAGLKTSQLCFLYKAHSIPNLVRRMSSSTCFSFKEPANQNGRTLHPCCRGVCESLTKSSMCLKFNFMNIRPLQSPNVEFTRSFHLSVNLFLFFLISASDQDFCCYKPINLLELILPLH